MWKRALLFFIAVVAFNVLLGNLAEQIHHPDGEQVLDLRFFGYTADEAYSYFEAIGPEGREVYSLTLWVDLFYPFAIFLFTSTLLVWSIGKKAMKLKVNKYLLLLPLFALVEDLLENSMFFFQLLLWPEKYNELLRMAGFFFTPAKWFFAAMVIFTILTAVAFRVMKPSKLQVGHVVWPVVGICGIVVSVMAIF